MNRWRAAEIADTAERAARLELLATIEAKVESYLDRFRERERETRLYEKSRKALESTIHRHPLGDRLYRCNDAIDVFEVLQDAAPDDDKLALAANASHSHTDHRALWDSYRNLQRIVDAHVANKIAEALAAATAATDPSSSSSSSVIPAPRPASTPSPSSSTSSRLS